VRWFFRVGGASGTVAKSMSAYDMAPPSATSRAAGFRRCSTSSST
jgi:hypothetical protein